MKFSGKIGFMIDETEVAKDIYRPSIVERPYVGELSEYRQQMQNTDFQNKSLTITNQVSIVSDLYLRKHYQTIIYIEINHVKWTVTSIQIGYPRIRLTTGEVYHENEIGLPEDSGTVIS